MPSLVCSEMCIRDRFFAGILMIQPALIMFLGGKDAFMWLLVIISVPLMFIYIFLIISIFKNAIKLRKS